MNNFKKNQNKTSKLPLAIMSSTAIASMFSMNTSLADGLGVTNLVPKETGYQVDLDYKITGVKDSSLKDSIKNNINTEETLVVDLNKNYDKKTSVKVKLGEDKAGKEYIVCYVPGVEVKESKIKIIEEKIKTGKEGTINFVTDHKSYFILVLMLHTGGHRLIRMREYCWMVQKIPIR